jgi:hypothetical protein
MSNPFTTKDPLVDIIKQVMLGEKKLTDAELKKREEIAKAMERENPGMDMSKKMAIATDTAKRVAEEVNLQEITTKSGADVDRNLDDHDPDEHGDIPDRKPDHELETHGGLTLHVHHVKDSKGKTKHTIINHVNDPAGGGTFVVKGHAHPKHILSSYNRAEREDMDESVNLDEQLENFWEAYTNMFNEAEDQQQNILLRAMAKDPSDLMKMKRAIKMGDKALTNPALRQEILAMLDKMMHLTTGDPSLLQRTRMGFQKAKKLPEEVELDEAREAAYNEKQIGFMIGKHRNERDELVKKASDPSTDTETKKLARYVDGKYGKALNRVKTTPVAKFIKKRKGDWNRVRTEEVQLEAIGAKDKQDEGEYGYEGDMAMSQLRTIIRNCQEMMKVLDKETDMPEWVQSKITLATDYLQTANDYLMSELEEAVRIRDRSRGFEKEVKYAGKTFAVDRHGDDKQTFQGQMDRKHLAVAAKARRKRTGPGVKGFNSAMRSAKASDGYQPQETGSVRAKNEEVEKAPFDGGQVKPRRTDAEIAKAVSALAKKARSVQKQKNKKDKM